MPSRAVEANVGDMTAYVAECYWLGVTEKTLADAVDQARSAADELSREGDAVRVTGSLLIPADEVAFLFIDTQTIERARTLGERAGIQFERVVEAIHLGPGGTP
jgi:hypothetical protein